MGKLAIEGILELAFAVALMASQGLEGTVAVLDQAQMVDTQEGKGFHLDHMVAAGQVYSLAFDRMADAIP